MIVQLHGFTHEIINTLLARKLFSAVLAIRHTNDCVSKAAVSETLTLCSTRGTVQISQDSAFLEVSVTVQLHRFTHGIINNLTTRKLLSVVLAIYFMVLPHF